MTEPIIIDTCPVLGCGEKLQTSATQDKWYQDCTFRWTADPGYGDEQLQVEFPGHYFGTNPDIEYRLYCGNDHTPEQIASAVAQRFAQNPTPEPTLEELRAYMLRTVDEIIRRENLENPEPPAEPEPATSRGAFEAQDPWGHFPAGSPGPNHPSG